MLCSRVQNYLSAYLDSELPGEEMLRIRAHLHQCEACRTEQEALRQTRRLMQSLRVAEPRHSFNLEAALSERGSRPSWWRLWALSALGALEGSPVGVLLFPAERARLWDELRRQARFATLCTTLGVVVLAAVLVQQPQKPDTVMALVPETVRLEENSFPWTRVEYSGGEPFPAGNRYVNYTETPFLESRPGTLRLMRFEPGNRQSSHEVEVFPVYAGRHPGNWPVVDFP